MASENEKNRVLCQVVKNFPVLFDQNHKYYNMKEVKEFAWESIALQCQDSVIACKKRWESITDSYNNLSNMCGYLVPHLQMINGQNDCVLSADTPFNCIRQSHHKSDQNNTISSRKTPYQMESESYTDLPKSDINEVEPAAKITKVQSHVETQTDQAWEKSVQNEELTLSDTQFFEVFTPYLKLFNTRQRLLLNKNIFNALFETLGDNGGISNKTNTKQLQEIIGLEKDNLKNEVTDLVEVINQPPNPTINSENYQTVENIGSDQKVTTTNPIDIGNTDSTGSTIPMLSASTPLHTVPSNSSNNSNCSSSFINTTITHDLIYSNTEHNTPSNVLNVMGTPIMTTGIHKSKATSLRTTSNTVVNSSIKNTSITQNQVNPRNNNSEFYLSTPTILVDRSAHVLSGEVSDKLGYKLGQKLRPKIN